MNRTHPCCIAERSNHCFVNRNSSFDQCCSHLDLLFAKDFSCHHCDFHFRRYLSYLIKTTIHSPTAIFGLATTSTFATWFFRERDDHKSYIASSITEYDGSSGHSLFLAGIYVFCSRKHELHLGWILAALSAAFEIFALCSSSREPDVPPLPTETQYPPSYGAASQPQAYQTYYKPSSPTAHV